MTVASELSDVVIRRIRPDDGATYRDLRLRALTDAPLAFGTTLAEATARPRSWWDARVAACSEGTTSALFVAETAAAAGAEAGSIGLAGAERSDVAGEVEVISMWVEPAVRGRGLGRRLLDAASAWASAQDAVALQLWVTEDNAPATRLYQAYGFTFTGDAQAHPSQPGLRELCMRCALPRYTRVGVTRYTS